MRINTRTLIITLMLLIAGSMSFSQQYDKVWVTGGGVLYRTSFNDTGTFTESLFGTYIPYFVKGHSNICDLNGELLISSNGFHVFNRNGQLIPNGDKMVPDEIIQYEYGFSGCSQSSIILPVEGDRYYFVTPTASDNEVINHWRQPSLGIALFDLLLYGIIEVNNGQPQVTKKKQKLLSNVKLSKSQMMACRHANGKDWWLLKQASDTNMVYRFLFTKDTVYGPYLQGFSEPHFTKWDVNGQSVFSPDGTKYATVCEGDYYNQGNLFMADFDRCTGLLSNPIAIKVPEQSAHNPFDPSQKDRFTTGVAFSPDGKFIYVTGRYNIQQLELIKTGGAGAWSYVVGLDTTWDEFQRYGQMYLGPDNKLYVGNIDGISGQMSVIAQPNIKGTGGFCARCMHFPAYYTGSVWLTSATTPPCMPNYRLGALDNSCDTTKPEVAFNVYPNPANQQLNITYQLQATDNALLQLYDITGRMVLSTTLSPAITKQQLQVGYLSIGLYQWRYSVNGNIESTGRILLTH